MAEQDPNIEEWRPVVGYEGWYEVSSLGQVRNSRVRQRTRVGKILKYDLTRKYPSVTLCANGKQRKRGVHILVAAAFIGPCPQGKEVNHKDGNKMNPRADNLEYLTQSENTLHGYRTGLHTAPKGNEKALAKVTPEIVRDIRREYAFGNARALGRKHNISGSLVAKIGKGERWRHVV